MFEPGAMAATCAAIVMNMPADPARAPLGATWTITGNGAPRNCRTTSRMASIRPPGVSRVTITAAQRSFVATVMARSRWAAVAPLITPLTSAPTTHGGGGVSVVGSWARRGFVASSARHAAVAKMHEKRPTAPAQVYMSPTERGNGPSHGDYNGPWLHLW